MVKPMGGETPPSFFLQRKIIFTKKTKVMEEKKGWGGTRQGSGRKRQGVKAVTFSASEDVWTYLSGVAKKSEFINEAIKHYISTKK